MSEIEKKWYVLRAISGKEAKVKEYLCLLYTSHMGNVMNAFRLSVVGECKGPHMFDITELIGKEETLARICLLYTSRCV